MTAYIMYATPERTETMDFTTAIYLTDYVLLVPYPQSDSEISRLTAIFRPFSTQVCRQKTALDTN